MKSFMVVCFAVLACRMQSTCKGSCRDVAVSACRMQSTCKGSCRDVAVSACRMQSTCKGSCRDIAMAACRMQSTCKGSCRDVAVAACRMQSTCKGSCRDVAVSACRMQSTCKGSCRDVAVSACRMQSTCKGSCRDIAVAACRMQSTCKGSCRDVAVAACRMQSTCKGSCKDVAVAACRMQSTCKGSCKDVAASNNVESLTPRAKLTMSFARSIAGSQRRWNLMLRKPQWAKHLRMQSPVTPLQARWRHEIASRTLTRFAISCGACFVHPGQNMAEQVQHDPTSPSGRHSMFPQRCRCCRLAPRAPDKRHQTWCHPPSHQDCSRCHTSWSCARSWLTVSHSMHLRANTQASLSSALDVGQRGWVTGRLHSSSSPTSVTSSL